jgi:hypothetical protein
MGSFFQASQQIHTGDDYSQYLDRRTLMRMFGKVGATILLAEFQQDELKRSYLRSIRV